MAQPIPQGYFAHNTEVLGYHDLNGKPAFKLDELPVVKA